MTNDFINSICRFIALYWLRYLDFKPNVKDDFLDFIKNYKKDYKK